MFKVGSKRNLINLIFRMMSLILKSTKSKKCIFDIFRFCSILFFFIKTSKRNFFIFFNSILEIYAILNILNFSISNSKSLKVAKIKGKANSIC